MYEYFLIFTAGFICPLLIGCFCQRNTDKILQRHIETYFDNLNKPLKVADQ